MTTHYVDFAADPGLVFSSVTLWEPVPEATDADSLALASAVIEHDPGSGRYRATFADVEGVYRLRGLVGGTLRADWFVEFAGDDGEKVGARLSSEAPGAGAGEHTIDGFTQAGASAMQSIVRGVRGTGTGLDLRKRELTLVAGDTRHQDLGNAIRFELTGCAIYPTWDAEAGWSASLFCETPGGTIAFDDVVFVQGEGDNRSIDVNALKASTLLLEETETGKYALAVYAPSGFPISFARESPAHGKLIVVKNLEPTGHEPPGAEE